MRRQKGAVQPPDREVRHAELIPLLRELGEHKGKQLYGVEKVRKQLRRDGVDVARSNGRWGAEGMMGAVVRRRRPRTTVPGYKL
jgi:hypothetical protein